MFCVNNQCVLSIQKSLEIQAKYKKIFGFHENFQLHRSLAITQLMSRLCNRELGWALLMVLGPVAPTNFKYVLS